MRRAYSRWLWSKLMAGRPPRLQIINDIEIGEWINFSEYWSFQSGLGRKEELFARRCLSSIGFKAVSFDVGANLGIFACALASLGSREVHAFEPIPQTFCRLHANVSHNGLFDRCHLNCLAVSDNPGLVTFRVQAASPATNRLSVGQFVPPSGKSEWCQTVAATTLDQYCAAKGVQSIDFLKIDVEGMEPCVLRGARELLAGKRIRTILIEMCPGNLAAVGMGVHCLFEAICTHSYIPFALTAKGELGSRLDEADFHRIVIDNVALLPEAP
jgi:FkbM family methyltransferase